ncbi:translation elongation factor Ts [bacterium]|nr:translation elongation factor Ts [bacterium]
MTSADLVKQLRERTGAGMMECKKALVETANDMEKAIAYLRERGLAMAAKKVGRAANEGRIHSYIHSNSKIGVMVEINCETDFVARTDDFQNLCTDIAMHVAAASPRFLNREEVPASDLEKEKQIFRNQAAGSGKPPQVIEKIVEGKIGKFYEENCLLEQKFVKDPDLTVEGVVKAAIAKLGENIAVKRYARFQLGEGAAKAETTESLN